jgi:hypothetical protein
MASQSCNTEVAPICIIRALNEHLSTRLLVDAAAAPRGAATAWLEDKDSTTGEPA